MGIDRSFERRLASLINAREPHVLQGGLKGVEKESLRVSPDGYIEQSDHPRELGSTLTHEHITTDYSEALIELVTPAFRESWELLQYLCDLHQFVYRHLGDQLLWATSMPCIIDGDPSIPIARYGRSNIGRMKEAYRRGLGWRYGRMMQAISGVHYNYSFPAHFWPVLAATLQAPNANQDFVSAQYFSLLRNYRRYGWLVLYLFGNSPAVCGSFVRGREHTLQQFAPGTLYEPYATSLRMSDLGYRNKSQAGVQISVNSLDEYVRDLSAAVSTPHPEYERIGVKVDGEYRQLNANLLQIENEYYSYIRPKRVARSAPRRRRVRRISRARRQCLRSRRREPEQAAVPRSVRRAVRGQAERADRPGRVGAARREPRTRRASRSRAGFETQPQWKPDRVARMGSRADRFDARTLRDARSRRRAAAVRRSARSATGQDRRSGAHTFGTYARGAALDGRVVRGHGAADVTRAQGLLPGPVPAERAAAGGVRNRGAGIAGTPGSGRSRRPRDFRPVSGELLPNVESRTGARCRRGLISSFGRKQ
jgi:hypothetical protein